MDNFYTYAFEKLEVWKLSKELVKDIYRLTSQFPKEEQYNLVSQLRRAAVSVSSNLAEGSSRLSTKDKAHFTVIAYSSLIEVLNQLIIAHELSYFKGLDYSKIRGNITELTNKINAYHKSQVSKLANPLTHK